MEEEVAQLIVHLLADENHKFMRPHAGGEAYHNIKSKHTHWISKKLKIIHFI